MLALLVNVVHTEKHFFFLYYYLCSTILTINFILRFSFSSVHTVNDFQLESRSDELKSVVNQYFVQPESDRLEIVPRIKVGLTTELLNIGVVKVWGSNSLTCKTI